MAEAPPAPGADASADANAGEKLSTARNGDKVKNGDKIELPPAKPIFRVEDMPATAEGAPAPGRRAARVGDLLGQPTPMFTLLTSRGMPLQLRPTVLRAQMEGLPRLFQLPIGDLVLRQEAVAQCPGAGDKGCRGFWPNMQGELTYCSFRNPLQNPSVYGSDSICSVETTGGRRKVGPKDLVDIQKVMRVDVVAAPGEEMPLDVTAPRRLKRAVTRAADWLREILEAKAQEPRLDFDWHVLANLQGGGDEKLRQQACASAASLPVAGAIVGGLGYREGLTERAKVLETVTSALPSSLPRFLPLNNGTPVEVLQGIILGIDVFEVAYPTAVAESGIALTFEWEMPSTEEGASHDGKEDELSAEAAASLGLAPAGALRGTPDRVARQMYLRTPANREDFGPLSEASPVRQYSRAYLYHLMEVRELLGTQLLVHHNLHTYTCFFDAIRRHTRQGTLLRYASWFLRTQLCEPPEVPASGPWAKKRRKT